MTAPAATRYLVESTLLAARKVGHRFSHGHLLVHGEPAGPGEVPAIVVPTIRNPAAIRDALLLGKELGRPVVALCSRWSSPQTVRKEAEMIGAHVIAVEVTDRSALPSFACDSLVRDAAMIGLDRPNDVSRKRNLGIAAARMLGWHGVVFLDDDITDLQPDAIRTAAGLLDSHNVAALRNVGYPDNSVVCHARREVGLTQDTFVGGGAMAVRVTPQTSFFPTIYNEDWFFLVGRRRIERVAVCGKVSQREYDPYLSPARARSEEFGDVLAEGLFALSAEDRPLLAATEEYWRDFLADRREMIDQILERLAKRPADDRRRRMTQTLIGAKGRCMVIDPAFCVRYLAAWREDLEVWRKFLAGLPRHRDAAEAFVALGLKVYEHRPR
ncbi:hypothetical protein [Actinoplanes sp. GCM10030250]|uniref:hypothetical protein n=1 Tax=Actinoplanes sp. GCM10030250 TaxID=3273376 RepID=UPI003613C436